MVQLSPILSDAAGTRTGLVVVMCDMDELQRHMNAKGMGSEPMDLFIASNLDALSRWATLWYAGKLSETEGEKAAAAISDCEGQA